MGNHLKVSVQSERSSPDPVVRSCSCGFRRRRPQDREEGVNAYNTVAYAMVYEGETYEGETKVRLWAST